MGNSLGINNRGTKAKSITSCDNAFVTNIVLLSLRCTHAFAQKTSVGPRSWSESEAAATNVFSVRKRKRQHKAPSRGGNQPHVMVMPPIYWCLTNECRTVLDNLFKLYRKRMAQSVLESSFFSIVFLKL